MAGRDGGTSRLRIGLRSAAIAALFVTLAAAPTRTFSIGVAAASAAASEAALIADVQQAASYAGVPGSEACWPMDETSGSSGFVNQCTATANAISFGGTTSGFTLHNASPTLVSATDATSPDFTSQAAALRSTSTTLSATAPWTVGCVFRVPTLGDLDLFNSGSAYGGAGADVQIESSGTVLYLMAPVVSGNSTGLPIQGTFPTQITANTTHVVVLRWVPTAGSTTDGGTATLFLDGVASTSQTFSFASSPTALGPVTPISGDGATSFVGNLEWLFDIPAALSNAAISNLTVNFTGV